MPDGKKSILEERLKDRLAHPATSNRIDPRPHPEIFPLSYAQERLWTLEQMDPGLIAFNRPWAIKLNGKLDVGALEASVTEITRRHEVLRSSYASIDGQSSQRIHPLSRVKIPIIDLRHLADPAGESRVAELAAESVQAPFELASGPLIRPKLVVLNDFTHILILTTHHIVFDGWSENVFLSELASLYEANIVNAVPKLPELPIQYSDFAYWQRQRLQGDVLNRLVGFWKSALADLPTSLDLPTDRPRPPLQTHNGAVLRFQLSHELSDNLRHLSQEYDLTLFMTLLAAFKSVLFLASGERDIAIATLSAGRTNRRLEPLIGFFVNSLVLRSDLSGNPTFHELLQRIRQTALAAFAHQELPFGKLVQELSPKRDAAHAPLVQHAFQLRNMPGSDAAFSQIRVESFPFDPGISIYDLSLSVAEADVGLLCEFVYNSDLFDASTISQFGEKFRAVLESVSSNPDLRLKQLDPHVPRNAAAALELSAHREAAQGNLENSNLTENQLLIWAGEQLWSDVPLYNVPYAFRIDTHIDITRFQKAFQMLVNQSDSLRTIFEEIEGEPKLQVLTNLNYRLEMYDLSHQAKQEHVLDQWLQERSLKAFDISRRVFDSALLKMSERSWVWFLNLHHIIADGWAIHVIFRQLQALYASQGDAKGGAIRQLPSFGEHRVGEREYRESDDYRAAHDYWKRKLENDVPALTMYGRHNLGTTTRVDRRIEDLGRQRTKELTTTAAKLSASQKPSHSSILNSTAALLCAYLYRVSGNRDLSLGTPFHNRGTAAERDTIGLLMNVLVLRVKIAEGETFRSLVKKVSEEVAESLRHRHYSVANPVNRKAYEVTLNYHSFDFSDFLGAPVHTSWIHTGHDEDTLTLRLHDYEKTGSLKADFEFNVKVFSAEQRERAVWHFLQILDEFLRDPDQEIDRAQILPPDELTHLLVDLNDSATSHSGRSTVIEDFEHRVSLAPLNTAVEDGTETISYAELNAKSNKLANYLRSIGIGPEKLVGLFVERSIEMIVGMLAIFKAGGAYLPLDPQYPRERLAYMMEDSQVAAILTQERLTSRLPDCDAKILSMDTDWNLIEGCSDATPPRGARPGNLAYVIYTSGSTGRPKGVAVEHGSLNNFSHWSVNEYQLSPKDRVLQFSSLTWDTSIEEIVPCLISGATLILRDDAMLDSIDLFLSRCRDYAISILMLPTAYWHELAQALDTTDAILPSRIRLVNIGGEPASPERLSSWRRRVSPRVRLINTYGLTESTAVATFSDLSESDDRLQGSAEVPIGRPISNMRAYILDEHLQPVPTGCEGELHISGIGLARGYLKNPKLTAQKFISNPFAESSSSRLFKTGDICRYSENGELVYLGRLDSQLKIRGYRIEPGEIESRLRDHPSVKDAAVIARSPLSPNQTSSDRRLVAYLVAKPEAGILPAANSLRDFLADLLPSYMWPSAYVFLDEFPTTASGKLDRQALPAPQAIVSDDVSEFVAPRDDLERTLARQWEQELGIRPVGIRDDFFDLGGHSLLAVRLFFKMEVAIGTKLPVMALFRAPTIERLALLIRSEDASMFPRSLVEIQPEGNRPPIYWIHAAGGHVLSYRNLAKRLGPNQPSYALQARGVDDGLDRDSTIPEMAASYIREIRAVQGEGPYYLGGLSFGGLVAWEMAQQLHMQGQRVRMLVLLDTRHPQNVEPFIFDQALYDLRQRIEFHLGNLSSLNAVAKVRYVLGRTGAFLERLRFRIQMLAQMDAPPDRGKRAARESYETASRARVEYTPQHYPGKLTLFRAATQPRGLEDPLLGWGGLAIGGTEVYEVPGAHVSIITGPRLRILADQLARCLEAAQLAEAIEVENDDE